MEGGISHRTVNCMDSFRLMAFVKGSLCGRVDRELCGCRRGGRERETKMEMIMNWISFKIWCSESREWCPMTNLEAYTLLSILSGLVLLILGGFVALVCLFFWAMTL